MRKRFRFRKFMLNGHSGRVTRKVKRVIVRGHNHQLVVTSSRRGPRFPGDTSYHIFGKAVDLGNKRRGDVGAHPGTPEARRLLVRFQRNLIKWFGCRAFTELFGPHNDLNCKNGHRIRLDEGEGIEEQHDSHVHVVPRRLLPWPKGMRKHLNRLRRRRQIRRARRAGAHFVPFIFSAADKHGVSYPLALALFEHESAFLNQYGHDRAAPGQCPIWHCREGRVMVTELNYRNYRQWRQKHGNKLAQGVGPGQLTSPAYQDVADRRGGCWRPAVNIDVSLEILAGHIRALGTFRGVGAYNGGRGNPQPVYARAVLAKRDRWARVIKG